MEDKNRAAAVRIAEAVRAAGGRVYYVGGLVRDELVGRSNKDIDIEVHGIAPDDLQKILREIGEVTAMGVSFGIFGLKGYEIDIAMPRSEKATGRGHKDFDVFVDPFLGEEKAAMRRDFTINAMMQDVLTGEVLDFFGGREDLKHHVIRHVNDRTFAEDPLRVLRAAQFAARFEYRVADETAALSSTMDLTALAKERVYGELEKALLKARHPSVFFEEMRRMNQLHVWFPEVEILPEIPQGVQFHPEGNVWNHTMMVLDAAAGLRENAEYPAGFMMAALTHDFGKAVTTKEDSDGKIHAYGHETEGLPLAAAFLKRISNENRLISYVRNMTELHMCPNQFIDQDAGRKAYMHLFDRSVSPNDLLLLAKADFTGRKDAPDYLQTEKALREELAEYQRRMELPFVQGRDLVEAGFTPGPAFSEALAYAHKLRLAGVPKKEALAQTVSYIRKL